MESAFASTERARKILEQLIKNSPNPFLLVEARRDSGHLLSRDELVDLIQRIKGEIREVRPFALCVEKTPAGKHVFWFGYRNTTIDQRFTIPIGKENKFTPPPFDRGQPTIFPPHEHILALRIVTDEPALTWHLEKYNVHASAEKMQPCPANLQERYTYEPPQRE